MSRQDELRAVLADLEGVFPDTLKGYRFLNYARAKLRAAITQAEQQGDVQANAGRYVWLRDNSDSDWAICEYSHDAHDGPGYYRDARAPAIVDAAIDLARGAGV